MFPISLISILMAVFFATTFFLGKELLKKFAFMRDFVQCSNQSVLWKYSGNRKPGMYNIVLRGKNPFCALVGFQLRIPLFGYSGFDHYGFAQSRKDGLVVISTYLGRTSCEFQFLTNVDIHTNSIVATSSEEDQKLQPDSKFTPHWYQRLGIYG